MIKNMLFMLTESGDSAFEFDSEAILDCIMNAIFDGIVIKDKQGKYVWINNAGALFLNRPIDDVIGKTDFDLFDMEAASKIRASDIEVMSQDASRIYTSFLKPNNAEARQFKAIKRAYKGKMGEVQGIINIVRDVGANFLQY